MAKANTNIDEVTDNKKHRKQKKQLKKMKKAIGRAIDDLNFASQKLIKAAEQLEKKVAKIEERDAA